MHIRPFRPDDLPRLKEITVEAFTGVSIDQGIEKQFGPIAGHDWRWRKARHLDEDTLTDPHGIFVAEIADRVVGYVSTWIDHETGIGHIPNLALVPECRGQGLGRQLLLHAFDHFHRAGITHAKIETLVQNEVGKHLYESLGFREVARQIHFVADLRDDSSAAG
ncbi:MAG: GNAT family N-acetyltransferase [Planctomycetales bacterium]|nr:GNAT family N-acetyltransferase [Planctomycetales bacterium]